MTKILRFSYSFFFFILLSSNQFPLLLENSILANIKLYWPLYRSFLMSREISIARQWKSMGRRNNFQTFRSHYYLFRVYVPVFVCCFFSYFFLIFFLIYFIEKWDIEGIGGILYKFNNVCKIKKNVVDYIELKCLYSLLFVFIFLLFFFL